MAKKRTEQKTKSFSQAIGLQYIFNNTITDFFLGLALVTISVVTIIAMVSFLNTGAADQSILEEMRAGEWTNSEHQFQNYCGSLGAIISYWLISQNFGFPSFLLPTFFIIWGLQLMHAYKINLWKWFFSTMIIMEWCAITFAKFLTPLAGGLIFNPGGKHGIFVVQNLENVVGAPGLTAILLFTAIAFLTYLTTETITVIRKALNPIGYITSKVHFEITNHGKNGEDNEPDAIAQAYANAENGLKQEEEEEPVESEFKDPEPAKVIDLDVNPDKAEEGAAAHNAENMTAGNMDAEHAADVEDAAGESASVAAATKDPNASFLENQRRLRNERAQAEAEEKKAAELASQHIGMDISVAANEEQASSNTVSSTVELNTPINPKEPFTRYKYPTLNLLKKYEDNGTYIDEEEQIANKNRIIEVLGNFGVQIKTIRATVGPTITLYEIQPAEGVRIAKIKKLEDDIALSLAALGIRIIAPIPGKGTIGIEVPNAKTNIVSMESILNSKKFQETKMELPIALGKTITNEVFMVDLAKIPHLLVAGATGQGKSVGLNAIITSLLYKKHPAELKFVMVDPKKVEFSIYSPIENHFLAKIADGDDEPIITDVQKVVATLKSLCCEMDTRYDLLKKARARNIKEYNAKFKNRQLNPENGHRFMPYIVVVIDEFGDLIMTAGKEIELPIARIAQLARAVGIHMIIATQRPTTNIITGTIKANFPARMAFKVSAMIDSRTILDRPGANQLIGRGDMLFLSGSEPVRVQCAFVDTPEVERITTYIAKQQSYLGPFELPKVEMEGEESNAGAVDMTHLDPLFEEAARLIVATQQGSTSMIQRKFAIGYNRAGRLMDQLEKAGIVGAAQGSKPREVLCIDDTDLEMRLNNLR